MRNWPDILQVAATLASGALPPSQLLRKVASSPRQHELAVTLREIGRVERTLFIVVWLLAAIVIYWNTAHIGEAVRQRKNAGLTVEPELLAHMSPLGWAHILLTGEYRWPKRR